jgi:large subunit ribosomal protein L35
MPSKPKPHKGLLKRAKITGKGKVKFAKPGKNHINSHMDGTTLRNKRRKLVAKKGDMKLLEGMVHRRLTPAESD